MASFQSGTQSWFRMSVRQRADGHRGACGAFYGHNSQWLASSPPWGTLTASEEPRIRTAIPRCEQPSRLGAEFKSGLATTVICPPP